MADLSQALLHARANRQADVREYLRQVAAGASAPPLELAPPSPVEEELPPPVAAEPSLSIPGVDPGLQAAIEMLASMARELARSQAKIAAALRQPPPAPPAPPKDTSIAEALTALAGPLKEAVQMNERVAEHFAKNKTFTTQVTRRDAEGRIAELRTTEG